MFGFFRRFKQKPKYQKGVKPTLKIREYPPKIILAWAKGAEGNSDLLQYLFDNGYRELNMTIHAFFHKQEAINWLMDNGFPHLLALVNASEENEEAMDWLKNNNLDLYYNMALAISGDSEGFKWIEKNSTKEIYYLTLNLQTLRKKWKY